MGTTNKVKGWTGVLMTEDSSSHWPIKHRHVYSETSPRPGVEFVCVVGYDGDYRAVDTRSLFCGSQGRRASLEFVCVFGHDALRKPPGDLPEPGGSPLSN